MKTIEEIVAEANFRGLWMNNLFQVHSHPASPVVPSRLMHWQANFRLHDLTFHEFGRGATMLEAVQDAYAKCAGVGTSPPAATPDPFS